MHIQMIKTKMQRRKSPWNILRMALMWARRGGVFLHLKRRVLRSTVTDMAEFFRGLGHSQRGFGALQYGDHELSFDATPMIHVKMHRPNPIMRLRLPHIPCIKPQAEDDDQYLDHQYSVCESYDDDDDDDDRYFSYSGGRRSFLLRNGSEDVDEVGDDKEKETEIDIKAEEFIANFYQQLKLQRQSSNIRSN